MFRRLVLAGFMAVTLLAFPAASASAGSAAAASRPQPVSIVSTMTMADPYNYGTFSAAGSHLICRSGTVNDTQYIWGPPTWFSNGDALITLDVDKTFTCRDGGQILVRFTAHQYYHDPAANNYIPTAEAFKWVVAGGTGAYARLQGQGLGVRSSLWWTTSWCRPRTTTGDRSSGDERLGSGAPAPQSETRSVGGPT